MSPFLGVSRYGWSARMPASFSGLEPDERLSRTHRVTVLDQPFEDRCGKLGGNDVPSAPLLDVPAPAPGFDRRPRPRRGRIGGAGPERPRVRGDEQPPLGDVPVL